MEDEFQPFWPRVQDQAVESYTMKEVFDMDSSVRVEAIENLGEDELLESRMRQAKIESREAREREERDNTNREK